MGGAVVSRFLHQHHPEPLEQPLDPLRGDLVPLIPELAHDLPEVGVVGEQGLVRGGAGVEAGQAGGDQQEQQQGRRWRHGATVSLRGGCGGKHQSLLHTN